MLLRFYKEVNVSLKSRGSLDCGSDHQFSVGLGRCAGVLTANFPFPEESFSRLSRVY